MRYTLTERGPQPVTSIVVDGARIVCPTDAQVDAAAAGYPLTDTPAPEYNPATQKAPTFVWELEEGAIVKVWTVTDKTADEMQAEEVSAQKASLQAQIAQVNANFEAFKSVPIIWTDGKGYLPRWVTEYYTPLLQVPEAFPYAVTSSDGSSSTMTLETFRSLYAFLVAASGAETARVNALLADLYAQLAALEA